MIANYHTHTWRCGHAAGDEEQYVKCAIDRGLQILGFSDHGPYPFPQGYQSGFRMQTEQLDGYVATILDLKERYASQLNIHIGLELEYYPAYFDDLLSILRDKPIEYMILGQHFTGNEIGERYCGVHTSDPAALKRYCTQTMEAMETGLFTYFAHPDLIHFVGSRRVYTEHMRQLCRAAKQCGMPLEINLLGLAEFRHYPMPTFWEIAAEEGCTAILGCDAHKSQALLDVESANYAEKMAKRMGITLLNTVPLRKI